MLLRENPLSDFIEELASANPTPGGGSAAAMAGAMAAALTLMSINITIKKKLEKLDEKIQKDLNNLEEMKDALVLLIDGDASAYRQVLNSFRMSKEADAQKQEGQNAIQESYKAAIHPPLEVWKLVNKLKRFIIALHLSGFFLENISSDVETAEALAEAASKGALANIEINLRAIKDRKFVVSMRKVIKEYC